MLAGKKIDTDTTASYFAKKTLDISLSHMDQFRHTANKKEDVQNIKAEFLIRHIDRSFENLNLYPWLEDIPRLIYFLNTFSRIVSQTNDWIYG